MSFNNPIRRFFDPLQDQQALNNELSKTTQLAEELRNDFLGIGKQIETIAKESMRDLDEEAKKVGQTISKDIAKGFRSLRIDATDLVDLEKKQLSGLLKVKDVSKVIESVKSNQESIERGIREAVAEGLIDEKLGLEYKQAVVERTKKQLELSKQLSEEAEKQEKTLGITYEIFDGITKIPILNSLVKIEKIKEAMEGAAVNTNSAFKVFGVGVGATFTQIGKSLKDPLILLGAQIALVKKFYDLYGDLNKRVVEQGKQLGINKEQSQVLYENAFKYASEQRNAFVTAERILEGRYKLNEALGTSIAFSEKEAITAEKLSHYYGISEEQNAHLAVLARETGQTNEDILNNVIRTSNEQKRQFGGSLQYQKTLQKVSSTSGEILTKFKGNVSALTAAVEQADRLGLTLEQVDKIGESLLNFEQSIEAELKAELLTGKAINVEKARAAALSGDTAKLTEEISKQVGNIHEFEKLNVIQRKAYAEVFGMSVGEMGDMLRKKELEAKLGVDISKSATEALALADKKGIKVEESVRKDLEAKSLAESQKYTFEKIESILKRISVGPMATIYNYIEKGLKGVEGIFGFFSKMTGGTLGSALGAAIIGAPLLIGITRLAMGTAKAIFFNGMSPATAPWVKLANSPMGGAMGGPMGANTITSSRGLVLTRAGGPAGVATPGAGGFMSSTAGLGIAAMGAGLLTSAITSNMKAGEAKTAVSAVGGAATGALTGAMLGSIIPGVGTAVGAVVGGLIGSVSNLISGMQEDREQRKSEEANNKEAQRKANETLEALATRPLELKVNNDTIANWNTYSQQNGANGRLSS